MDVDTVNPLELTLEDYIHLNKRRNKESDQKPSTSHEVITIERSTLTNGHANEDYSTSVGSPVKPYGSRSIHDRLGWTRKGNQYQNSNHGRCGGKTMLQNQALRAIRNAQNFKNRNPVRKVTNNNNRMPPPLTTSVLNRHNQNNGNFMVTRRNGASSVFSSVSSQRSRPALIRHSTKKCLNPEIQQIIRGFLNDNKPAKCQADEEEMIIDYSMLEQFRPKLDTTSLLTHTRFVMNG